MSIIQLGYVGFGVSDLAAWETLATKVLGLRVSERAADGTLYLGMDDYYHRLVLRPTGEDDLIFAGWQVPTPRDFQETVARIRASGTEVVEGTPEEAAYRKVKGLARFRDPSGNPFELFWGPRCGSEMPIAYGRPLNGFHAGPLGVGHLVLWVNDRQACEDFYLDAMGLRLTDYGLGRLAFFRCNPRHHSLAVAQAEPGWNGKRMMHLMLQVETLDDVGLGLDAALRHGVPVSRGLGKHTNDYAVSFYVETPSGWELEYGFGAREVDESTWFVASYTGGDPWGHHRNPYGAPPASANGSAVGPAARTATT